MLGCTVLRQAPRHEEFRENSEEKLQENNATRQAHWVKEGEKRDSEQEKKKERMGFTTSRNAVLTENVLIAELRRSSEAERPREREILVRKGPFDGTLI